MRITDFILCDDIRSEVGNKLSILGVYGESFLVKRGTQFPARAFLATFVRMHRDAEDPYPDTYRMEILFNGEPVGVDLRLPMPEDFRDRHVFQIANHLKPMVLPGIGVLGFRIELSLNGDPVMPPFIHETSIQYEDVTPNAPNAP